MTTTLSEPLPISAAFTKDAALSEFLSAVRTIARENDEAVTDAKPALARIAAAIARRHNGQALCLRRLLASLYTGGGVHVDLSDVMSLDWTLRKDLCAVLLAFGHGEFGCAYMKSAFEQAGDYEAQWFLTDAHDSRERLKEALTFAKQGSTGEPRSSSERRVFQLLVSLFAGVPVDLRGALRGLDAQRTQLVLDIIADYLAGRFDFTDDEIVKEHFGCGS